MKNIKQTSFLILFLSVLILSSCGTSYDRGDFKFQEFMDSNGSDIAEYLQENWEIDSAMIMHIGFFKAREWKEIYPEEMQTIFVGDDRYSESEYLDQKGFDVNAPLFVVYFSKLKKVEGNSFDDAGVNPGSLLKEKSQSGIDAANHNYESANYNYEDRVYYMAYATYVDGEFKLLMCCDSENYNDEIAFPMYYDQINNQKEFYSHSMGGGINPDMHKAKEGQIYSSARIEFAQFLKGQQIALFAPDSKRKNIQSEYELLYKSCTKPSASTLKSMDYFYMLYNGDFVRSEIDQKVNESRDSLNGELQKLIDKYTNVFGNYNTAVGFEPEDKKYLDLYFNYQENEESQEKKRDQQLVEILRHFQKYSKIIEMSDRISEKVSSIMSDDQQLESEKYTALTQIRSCIKRGVLLSDPYICQKESVADYEKKLTEIDSNFDVTINKLINNN